MSATSPPPKFKGEYDYGWATTPREEGRRAELALAGALALFVAIFASVVALFSYRLLLKQAATPPWSFSAVAILFFVFGLVGALFLHYLLFEPLRKLLLARALSRREPRGAEPLKVSEGLSLDKISEDLVKSREEIKRWNRDLKQREGAMRKRLSVANEELVDVWTELVQSEKLASLGQMAADIVHEIKNPVAIINTAAYCLKEVEDKRGRREQLEIIEQEVKRMERMVGKLLSFSHPMAASETKVVDINGLLEKVLSRGEAGGRFKQVKLERALDPALSEVRINPDQLEQVFRNIIDNALQAMPDGGTLRIVTSAPHGFVFIEFTDTGCGIPPEEIKSIFDPFFTTRDEAGGTGLGLSISLGIVKRAGGTLKVESQPGKGSTFIIELPAAST